MISFKVPVDELFCCGSSMKNMVNLTDEHISGFLPQYPDVTA